MCQRNVTTSSSAIPEEGGTTEAEMKRLSEEQDKNDDEVALGVCLHANSVEVITIPPSFLFSPLILCLLPFSFMTLIVPSSHMPSPILPLSSLHLPPLHVISGLHALIQTSMASSASHGKPTGH